MVQQKDENYQAKLKENTAQLQEFSHLNKYGTPDLVGLVRTAVEILFFTPRSVELVIMSQIWW